MKKENKTFVIIGAGPVGISAAAHLQARGLEPLVLEKGAYAGHAISEWGHVRVFTPWKYVIDKAVVALLKARGWEGYDPEYLPTGKEIVDEYIKPAAATPELKSRIVYNAEVIAVSKQGLSKLHSGMRNDIGYAVHYRTADGTHRIMKAAGVIDASGTSLSPNPMGLDGLPVPGEEAHKDSIVYGIPDILGEDKGTYKGKRTLVIGGGHSAINGVLDILKLKKEDAETKLVWGLRGNNFERLFGGDLNDALPARGELGRAAKNAMSEGALELLAPLEIQRIQKTSNGLHVECLLDGKAKTIEVDTIVVNTGFRPNLDMLRELHLDIDKAVEAPSALAPLIDPNHHSCGTVRPHGIDELSHPDANFFIVGMKAYGRAPSFLMLTGYEQVRSIADELAGNHEAARTIELHLPETGVCKGCEGDEICSSKAGQNTPSSSSCCGISSRSNTDCAVSPNNDNECGERCEASPAGCDTGCEASCAAEPRTSSAGCCA